ncbi:MAG: Gfo/Idh/MocA family oxidoreductase [archaeon]
MAKDQVGVGILGVGFVGGQAHAPAFKKIPGSKLIGLAAKTEQRVRPLAEKYDVEYFLDYMDLIRRPDVDAVVVATPTPSHYEQAKAAIECGKHVMCEMPLASTIAQVHELGKLAEKAGVIMMPVLNFRYVPNYVRAKELLNQGAIGSAMAVCFREFIPARDLAAQWPRESWAWDKAISGGYPDFTLSVWSIDLLRWLLGTEYAETEWKTNYIPLEEFGGILGYTTVGLARMTNGVVCSLLYSCMTSTTAPSSRLEIFGKSTATLCAEWNNSLILTKEEPARQEWRFKEQGTRVWGHYQMDEHFISSVLGKTEPEVTIEDGRKAQEIAAKMVA